MLSTASSSYQLKFEGRTAEIKKWGGKSKERKRNRKRDIGQKIKKRGEQEQSDEGRVSETDKSVRQKWKGEREIKER